MPQPSMTQSRWRLDGVRVVHANELDINTPQTPGMNRAAAITYARAGAEKLWAGTGRYPPQSQNGRPPSWTGGECDLCGERTRSHALG